jgi:hypothetical protein
MAADPVTPTLKLITGRSRRRADLGTADIQPYRGAESFPPGSTTDLLAPFAERALSGGQ